MRGLSPLRTATIVQQGDFVTLDFEGSIAGKPFTGGKGENYVLEVGAGQTLPQFEEAVIGLTQGVPSEDSGSLSGELSKY